MRRTITITLLILVVAVSAVCQRGRTAGGTTPAARGATPTVDQIIDRYVEAIGGEAAVRRITSRSMKGTYDMPSQNLIAPFEILMKAPNKMLMLINIPNAGLVSRGFDGTTGWAEDPQNGLRDLRGAELAQTKLSSDIHYDIKLKELYPRMTLKGKEVVNDREAYVIEAVPAEGRPEKLYFDTQSGLLVRKDAIIDGPQGEYPSTTYMQDYRAVDGVKVPFSLQQKTPFGDVFLKLTAVQNNINIDNKDFEKPVDK
jgi:hypothetical protein